MKLTKATYTKAEVQQLLDKSLKDFCAGQQKDAIRNNLELVPDSTELVRSAFNAGRAAVEILKLDTNINADSVIAEDAPGAYKFGIFVGNYMVDFSHESAGNPAGRWVVEFLTKDQDDSGLSPAGPV